jgi:ion channel-forming bestrophin family protein
MIIDRRVGVLHLIRASLRLLCVLFLWDLVIVLNFILLHRDWMDQPALPFSLVGAALVLFLNIRNNTAYNRWWEARTLWGAITNNARSFGRQAASLLEGAPDLTRAMAAYTHALRGALSGADVAPDLRRLLPPPIAARIQGRRNQPIAILHEIGVETYRLAQARGVDPAAYAGIDRTLSELSNAQGGLERIRNTPLAIHFSILPRLLVDAFCIVLPFSMVQELGWLTPLGSTLVGFLFLAFDEIGRDLEDPFTASPHALPMVAMATTIEIDLLQPLRDEVPPAVQATNGVLP